MYPNIDSTKLTDVQGVADKLAALPEKVLLYIAGYAEGARDATRGQPQSERDSA